jgi:hypothetical protein
MPPPPGSCLQSQSKNGGFFVASEEENVGYKIILPGAEWKTNEHGTINVSMNF